MQNVVYTVGHSTHSIEHFVGLLTKNKIDVVADVRSSPYSGFNPQFNKEDLAASLQEYCIKYVFLGDEFGARSSDQSCYIDGKVQYDRLAKTELFRSGVERIRQGVDRGYKIALVCAEKEPLDCHRTILVSRNLEKEGFNVVHILDDGLTETQKSATERLVKQFKLHQPDLFLSDSELVEKAFKHQEEKIAYVEAQDSSLNEATR
jgi:uncharacterized protein (DUF488 family)